jgi:tyrosyl-tRNA synthetase
LELSLKLPLIVKLPLPLKFLSLPKLIIEMKNIITELQWRGLVHDIMPGTEEQLLKEMTTTYIGFDPTSDSLHIGSLVPIILLVHLGNFGHKPIALVGGATGMIGDPSGKSDERNLLDETTLNHNVEGIKRVLSRFLDFNSKEKNAPVLVNNYDWMKGLSFINFARDVGKRITVNYMMAKDSVKKRLTGDGEGMSFTEFTYQLIQGYDFYHLHKEYNCLLQMGGSDQWGNITTGTELVRRMNHDGAKAFAMTCPLITKADGSKFGKSEGGNVWLTADKTSVYKFYQFWLNTTDVDAEKYIKIFTFLEKDTIDALIEEHKIAPHIRVLQRKLAEELTVFVHSKEDLDRAITASNILFGNATADDLKYLDEATFLEVFEGVPQAEIARAEIESGINIVDVLNEKTGFLKSNGEARRALTANAISVNKDKVIEEFVLSTKDLINNQFVLLQSGKKNYFVIRVV